MATTVGTIINGKYEILKQIGKGGMSVVYLAMDIKINKQWAIKEIVRRGRGENDLVIENSLRAEAEMMKKLAHPALPTIVDIIETDTVIQVVMDYIEGESLDKILLEQGAQPEDVVLDWAKQLCDVLGYLHSRKPAIIYRDIKPGNAMLSPEGYIKMIDFGIAREYREDGQADTVLLGTKGYAPPEQYGAKQTDGRSDIFSLGMTMYHCLTGMDPRRNDFEYRPVRQIRPDLSDGIEAIIHRCIELDPDSRYQNCAELMYDLEHPDLITKGYKKRQKRKLSLFVASFGLSVVLCVGGVVCSMMGTSINNNDYDNLVSILPSTALAEKVASYQSAIAIYPNNPLAYMRLLEAYEDAGLFSKAENDTFLALYNKNQDFFATDSVEHAELLYQIGRMYFGYYTEADGSISYSSRVQKALPFFEQLVINESLSPDFENITIANCYYQICYFYDEYILDNVQVQEASQESYLELFSVIEQTIEEVEGASPYDQLSFYNAVFMLLYDQRANLVSMQVPLEQVLALFDTVYEKATALTVQKEQSQLLQNEINTNYAEYRQSIERAYTNAAERE